jgi:hypothetical protein
MNGCGKVSGNAEPIEEMVEAYTHRRLQNTRVRERIAELRTRPNRHQGEIAELQLRATELEQQLDQPGVPVTTVLRALDRVQERQNRLLSQMTLHPAAPIPDTRAAWPQDLEQRRVLIDLVVEQVTLSPTEHPGRNAFDKDRVAIERRKNLS